MLVRNRDQDLSLFGTTIRANSRQELGYVRAARASESAALLRDEVPML
jgi:hypothetical protein